MKGTIVYIWFLNNYLIIFICWLVEFSGRSHSWNGYSGHLILTVNINIETNKISAQSWNGFFPIRSTLLSSREWTTRRCPLYGPFQGGKSRWEEEVTSAWFQTYSCLLYRCERRLIQSFPWKRPEGDWGTICSITQFSVKSYVAKIITS